MFFLDGDGGGIKLSQALLRRSQRVLPHVRTSCEALNRASACARPANANCRTVSSARSQPSSRRSRRCSRCGFQPILSSRSPPPESSMRCRLRRRHSCGSAPAVITQMLVRPQAESCSPAASVCTAQDPTAMTGMMKNNLGMMIPQVRSRWTLPNLSRLLEPSALKKAHRPERN